MSILSKSGIMKNVFLTPKLSFICIIKCSFLKFISLFRKCDQLALNLKDMFFDMIRVSVKNFRILLSEINNNVF